MRYGGHSGQPVSKAGHIGGGSVYLDLQLPLFLSGLFLYLIAEVEKQGVHSKSIICLSAKCLHRTRFQLILPVQSQNVTKNRTDQRMHVEGIQICQING